MRTQYLTVEMASEGFYKEKGSKFIAHCYPVQSENDIKEKLEALRKQYYDARHHCYAYIIGEDSSKTRANDDGEPNHSAGDPILGQLKSYNLTNTLVVVIRYFGGTKLGVGGLIHAYKTAAEEAIQNNKIKTVGITQAYQVEFPYEHTAEVMRLLNDLSAEIIEQHYTESCSIRFKVVVDQILVTDSKFQLLLDTGHHLILKKE